MCDTVGCTKVHGVVSHSVWMCVCWWCSLRANVTPVTALLAMKVFSNDAHMAHYSTTDETDTHLFKYVARIADKVRYSRNIDTALP